MARIPSSLFLSELGFYFDSLPAMEAMDAPCTGQSQEGGQQTYDPASQRWAQKRVLCLPHISQNDQGKCQEQEISP